jgi:hypothetical protein
MRFGAEAAKRSRREPEKLQGPPGGGPCCYRTRLFCRPRMLLSPLPLRTAQPD